VSDNLKYILHTHTHTHTHTHARARARGSRMTHILQICVHRKVNLLWRWKRNVEKEKERREKI